MRTQHYDIIVCRQHKQDDWRDQGELVAELSDGVDDRAHRAGRGRERGGGRQRAVRPSGGHVLRETAHEQEPGVHQRRSAGRFGHAGRDGGRGDADRHGTGAAQSRGRADQRVALRFRARHRRAAASGRGLRRQGHPHGAVGLRDAGGQSKRLLIEKNRK